MPLAAIRVVELGNGPGGAYCGKIFSDFGAEVIRIVAGSISDDGAYAAWLNTNKVSLIANHHTEEGARLILELLADADVLIDARTPQAAEDGPLCTAALRKHARQLIIGSVSWFGETGSYSRYAGSDLVCRALAGIIKLTGPVEGPPVTVPDFQVQIMAGLTSFTAIAAALLSRRREGRRLEISAHESALVFAEYQLAQGLSMGPATRYGINRFRPTFPIGIYPCRIGLLGVTVITPAQWKACCDLLEMQEEGAEPRYLTNIGRTEDFRKLEMKILSRLRTRRAEEWFASARKLRLPWVVVPTMKQLIKQPVYQARHAFGAVQVGAAAFTAPVLPLALTRTPPIRNGVVSPAEIGASWTRPRVTTPPTVSADALDRQLPLHGMRIVDLSMGWAGPLATRQFADLGAEVIKIEACQYPDWWRGHDPRAEFIENRGYEKSTWFNTMNRNKTGITLDLSSSEGVTILKRLVRSADAVVENYTPEVLPKLGIDYSVLVEEKPDLVMLSMPAFSATSAWSDCRAYGSTLEHASGLPSVTGMAGTTATMNHLAYGDPNGGLNGAAALMVALLHRKLTGEGQHIDLSQVEAMFPLGAYWIIEQSLSGKVPVREGNRHPFHAPHGIFRCAGDDQWLAITVITDDQWRCLCAAIERPDLLDDVECATSAGRKRRQEEIETAISQWLVLHTADNAMRVLQSHGVPAGRVLAPLDLLEDEHLRSRSFWQSVERSFVSLQPQASAPFREGARPFPVIKPAPTLGEDNQRVFVDLLGMAVSEIDELVRKGVIGNSLIQRQTHGIDPARNTLVNSTDTPVKTLKEDKSAT